MNEQVQQALMERLVAMADDEVILGHRDSEWTGHAPILEEDIAIANIAQDELGHAIIWYELAEPFTGNDADSMAFFRDARQFRNVQMVELPKGDWAFTMMRQFLYDAYEMTLLARLAESAYEPLAEAADKVRREEIYHYRHSSTWVRRLGLGTEESNTRMQRALDHLWPYALQLFRAMPNDSTLIEAGMFPDLAEMRAAWEKVVVPYLQESDLTVPEVEPIYAERHHHTEHLVDLLADMQMVARSLPEAVW
ncbi:MAG: phenylacetate-CoA oxygenase subunit PaaC [Chloroflexi bacterium]|nr:phenylacetate-CoA oxygenase subunit PaaC [Chloroflexota bacterium]